MDVRRMKRMGGHLPSAAKPNTMPVLFGDYLSGDPGPPLTGETWLPRVPLLVAGIECLAARAGLTRPFA